ncbi:MAG: DUF4118 domain-containing protein [Terriglobales bacterium]
MKHLRTSAVMIGSVAAAALLTRLLRPHLHAAVSIVFVASVMVSAWYGGMVSGLIAAAASVLTFELLFHRGPDFESVTAWAIRTVMFVAVSLLVSYLDGQSRNALERLQAANAALEDTLAHARRLESLLPICAGCKRIRDKNGEWVAIERFLHVNAGTDFTHGMCPECLAKYSVEVAVSSAPVRRA